MFRRRCFFLLYSFLVSLLFCSLVSVVSAESIQLAPNSATIAQKFLADRQKSEASFRDAVSASDPQSPSQRDSLLEPLKITLSPNIEISPSPAWVETPPIIDKASSSVEIFIPALANQPKIENFAITVNFYDTGDGGPLLEKQGHQEKTPSLLCSGLGINGPAVGLNSRTIAIPEDLALDGGKIIVRHVGRFEQIRSIILRPGHTAMVSVLRENFFPAMLDTSHVIEKEEADGGTPLIKKGDFTYHHITSAELSAPMEQLDGSLEFAFDMREHPQATLFQTEIQGLDLESHMEIELNGRQVGPLNISGFQLDSPELIPGMETDGHMPSLQYAGWRSAYLYIPHDFWKEKNNRLLLIVMPGAHPSGSKIHLKNSCLEVLYGVAPEAK